MGVGCASAGEVIQVRLPSAPFSNARCPAVLRAAACASAAAAQRCWCCRTACCTCPCTLPCTEAPPWPAAPLPTVCSAGRPGWPGLPRHIAPTAAAAAAAPTPHAACNVESLQAVKKAVADAKRNLVTVPLNKNSSFPHRIDGIFGAAKVRALTLGWAGWEWQGSF